ncbi:hypothetical protein D9M71_387070 [compost metagenome]
MLRLQPVQLGGDPARRQAAIGQPGRKLGRVLAADQAVAAFLVLKHTLGFPEIVAQPRQGRGLAAGKGKGRGRYAQGLAEAEAGQGGQGFHQAGGPARQRGQGIGHGAGLEDVEALLQQGAELVEHRRQIGQRRGQLLFAQQAVALQLGQRHPQGMAHPANLGALVGRHLVQGQHFVQIHVLHQGGDHQLGMALHHQQARTVLAQAGVEGGKAFQQEARAVHAQPARAERRRTEQRRVEDIQGQQAIRLQCRLQRRMVIESEVLLEPEQRAAHGGFPRLGYPLPTTLPAG